EMNNSRGGCRLSVTDAAGEVVADRVRARVGEVLAIPAAKRSPAQVDAVFGHWRTTVPEFQDANDEIEKLWQQWPEGSTSLVVQSRTDPRNTHILKRGNFLKPGEEATAGVPAFLHPLPPHAHASRL